MPMDIATVRSWLEGFDAARDAEREGPPSPGDAARALVLSLQLSSAALASRAPAMAARRTAEDERIRETWCHLKQRLRR